MTQEAKKVIAQAKANRSGKETCIYETYSGYRVGFLTAKTVGSAQEVFSPIPSVRCDQCQALMIQGMFCHETGCPNTHSRLDSESGSWIKQRKCGECGCVVDADDLCCDAQDQEDEVETCSECGVALDDGEGYDGMCGSCADSAEEEHEDTDSLEDHGITLGSYES